MKWGEYSNDVQFILHRNDVNKNPIPHNKVRPPSTPTSPTITQNQLVGDSPPEKSKEIQKSLTFR